MIHLTPPEPTSRVLMRASGRLGDVGVHETEGHTEGPAGWVVCDEGFEGKAACRVVTG